MLGQTEILLNLESQISAKTTIEYYFLKVTTGTNFHNRITCNRTISYQYLFASMSIFGWKI